MPTARQSLRRVPIGGDLDRLENRLELLDFNSMGNVLPGVYEVRDRDANCWYRLLYVHLKGLIHVLHCFTKTTNQTAQSDINIARDRLKILNEEIPGWQKEKKHGQGKKHR